MIQMTTLRLEHGKPSLDIGEDIKTRPWETTSLAIGGEIWTRIWEASSLDTVQRRHEDQPMIKTIGLDIGDDKHMGNIQSRLGEN